MGQRISGPGIGLAPPQYLYPSEINPAQIAPDLGNNWQVLAPGEALPIPEGSFYVRSGRYCVLQYLDPINQIWRHWDAEYQHIYQLVSDGFNYRVANLTGCPVAAVVTAGGSGFTSTPTVTAGTGTSTWQAIVGGMLSLTTVANAGKGYGITPILMIPAPPAPGVQATAVATLASGTVSGVTLTNVGAGYVTAPTVTVVPSPYDPNLATTTITPATVTLAVVGSGSISAVLCTNPGASVSSAPTLTVAGGGGSGATVSAVWMNSLISATVASTGTWTGGAALESIGGNSGSTPWNTQPEISGNNFVSRPIQALLSGGSSSLTSIASLYDGGLFLSTPTLIVSGVAGNVPSSLATATITATYGGVTDIVMIQPAP